MFKNLRKMMFLNSQDLITSYESWRKICGNKIYCCAPRAEGGFVGREMKSRMHTDIADEAQLQMGVDPAFSDISRYWLVGDKDLDVWLQTSLYVDHHDIHYNNSQLEWQRDESMDPITYSRDMQVLCNKVQRTG
jgi:hypothetical protein